MLSSLWLVFGVDAPVFDPSLQFVTSPLFSPLALGIIRLVFAVYTLITLIVVLAWQSVVEHTSNSFLSYFTYLSYTGLCAYFWASSVQTLAFARTSHRHAGVLKAGSAHYPLQTWPKALQVLHSLLWSTITVFPIIVTAVFWALLAGPAIFSNKFSSWSNLSVHALNTAFAAFEIFFSNVGPQPWAHIIVLIILLGLYLGVAYITHATQGFYTYSFLNPKKEHARLAGYIFGIAIAAIVLFAIVWCVCWLRARLFRKRNEAIREAPYDGDEAMTMEDVKV